ncbi:tetraprenyl-beta-curcumene synthase family protein [Plectonema cf. radiosum LEGE 06105]|uniref:Tetraprenyl-beta-curcumene synthase family protein n=1 Tax=Plectonema cf. radiosum LEGE 06105 TaxID=945769 RepID=A0A8J7EYW6_9CYAN|nr:tetraprenyl-beta-curcumene synthase family protein [Plectonema radiosum]MBE9212398.1 tetraprenyl-beta-curcumene synthase family protein [Plectonema cf. radiosum LEGE 06105]
MDIPVSPWGLMSETYFKVFPAVRNYLNHWKIQAQQIPNLELRKQACTSIEDKQFHCEGGSIYGLLAMSHWHEAVEFIVAYQTISDYLDNLCDRSNSLDPEDFRALHESMVHALMLDSQDTNYYWARGDQADGGYLQKLVRTCQLVLRKLSNYSKIAPTLHELANYYCDLQVHKHVKLDERVPRLKTWFCSHQENLPPLRWYEFSACAGSTLGIFCLVAYAFDRNLSDELTLQVKNSYFPWVQGLHILLDYLIDQEEDRINGDLNFCFYYKNNDEIVERFEYFIENAMRSVSQLPHTRFHQLINQALLGVYLSNKKVKKQQEVQNIAKQLIHLGGNPASFFFRSRLLMSH